MELNIPLRHAQRVMLDTASDDRGRLESIAHMVGSYGFADKCHSYSRGLPEAVQERLDAYTNSIVGHHITADERKLGLLMLLIRMGELMPVEGDNKKKRASSPWEVLERIHDEHLTAMALLLPPEVQAAAS